MTRRCPICDQPVPYQRGEPLPQYFPFCSERCRLIDLGKWLDGNYSISRPLTPTEKLEALEHQRMQGEEGKQED